MTRAAKVTSHAKLWQCKSFEEQVLWVKTKLEAGATLSDPGIWLGGADPAKIIRKLRKGGMDIETVKVELKDAADEVHKDVLAWRLKPAEGLGAAPAVA